jgi:hypothetical protein
MKRQAISKRLLAQYHLDDQYLTPMLHKKDGERLAKPY